jgi:hypothetical protein
MFPLNDISSEAFLLNTVQLRVQMLLPFENTAFPSPSYRYIWL